jgi:hypothetical protein
VWTNLLLDWVEFPQVKFAYAKHMSSATTELRMRTRTSRNHDCQGGGIPLTQRNFSKLTCLHLGCKSLRDFQDQIVYQYRMGHMSRHFKRSS